jgi:hypothetical protein
MIGLFEGSQRLRTNPKGVVAREFMALTQLLHRESLVTEFGSCGKRQSGQGKIA